jgi:molybdate transport system permease protein
MIKDALIISLKTATISTLLTTIIGVILAYRLSKYKGIVKNIIESLLMFPLFFPPSVIGYIVLVVFGKNGVIGSTLNSLFGLEIIFTIRGAIIAMFIVSLPIIYQSSKTAFMEVQKEYKEAAKLDGASDYDIFLKIVLPISKKGIFGGMILAFGRAFGEFGATMMVSGNIPGKTQNIPMAMYYLVEGGNLKEANIILMIVIIISTTLIFLHNKLLKTN